MIICLDLKASDSLFISSENKSVSAEVHKDLDLHVSSYTNSNKLHFKLNQFDTLLISKGNGIIDTLYADHPKLTELMMEKGYCFCESCILTFPLELEVRSQEFTIISLAENPIYLTITTKSPATEKEIPQNLNIPPKEPLKLSSKVNSLKKGDLIELDQIFFVGGSTQYLETSKPQLEELKAILFQQNSLEISIEGHVNGLYNDTLFYNQLSLGRANAIKYYLSQNGVNSSRIRTVGYGNKKMVFPNPKDETQMRRNRRVEIRITKE